MTVRTRVLARDLLRIKFPWMLTGNAERFLESEMSGLHWIPPIKKKWHLAGVTINGILVEEGTTVYCEETDTVYTRFNGIWQVLAGSADRRLRFE